MENRQALGPIAGLLEADHERLDALLQRAVESGAAFDRDAFDAFRAGLLRHIAIEEKLLLVEAKRRLGRPLPGGEVLRAEHSAVAMLLCVTPDARLALEVRRILERHDAREEGPEGFYAVCEAIVGDEVEALADRVAAFPPIRPAPYRDAQGLPRTADEALERAARGKGLSPGWLRGDGSGAG